MRFLSLIACVFLVTASFAQGQMRMESRVNASADRGLSADDKKRLKPTPEQMERGHQMLEAAEAQAAGLQGGMRAYAQFQVARAFESTDRKKALELLSSAFAATHAIDDEQSETRAALQRQILQEMIPLAPDRVDELLAETDAPARGPVLNVMVDHYQKSKQLDRAVEILYRLAHEGDMPYGATARVMQALPEEKSSDVQQLFLAALNSFENSKPQSRCMGDCDFAQLVLRFSSRLPKQAVLDAIHSMLKQAKDSQKGAMSMASDKGAVAFNSFYEYRLFQLLPVLHKLDESEAKKLLEEHQQVQTLLSKYPDGTNSLSPNSADAGGPSGGPPRGMGMMTMSDGPGPGGNPGARPAGPAMPTPMEMQQVMRIMADAEKHPRDAMANCGAISSPQLRAQAYQGIASATWKNEASVASEALHKLLDVLPQLETQQQMFAFNQAAAMFLDMGETEDAKKVVEKGMAAADKAYKADNNADDPNKALKAYWPSAEGYRSMLRTAVRISPAWAASLVKDISDPEMKVVVQIAMAGSLLDVPAGSVTIMSSTKSGGTTMMNMVN